MSRKRGGQKGPNTSPNTRKSEVLSRPKAVQARTDATGLVQETRHVGERRGGLDRGLCQK